MPPRNEPLEHARLLKRLLEAATLVLEHPGEGDAFDDVVRRVDAALNGMLGDITIQTLEWAAIVQTFEEGAKRGAKFDEIVAEVLGIRSDLSHDAVEAAAREWTSDRLTAPKWPATFDVLGPAGLIPNIKDHDSLRHSWLNIRKRAVPPFFHRASDE